MAIDLPRASPASVSTSRRPRRVRTPTAGDVPPQNPGRDPGLNVPVLDDVGKGLELAGAGLTEVGERLKAADDRIKTRQEALDRMRIRSEVREKFRDLLESADSTSDLSAEGALDALGEQATAIIAESGGGHHGRDESKLRLQELLEAEKSEFSDKAAMRAVEAGDRRTDQVAGEIIDSLSARAFNGENVADLIDEGMEHIAPGAELRDSLRPGGEINYARLLNRRVMTAGIERLFVGGHLQEIRNMLDDPAVQRALGEQGQREIFRRLSLMEQERAKPRPPVVLSPGQSAVDPRSGKTIASVPAPKTGEKPVVLSPGQTLVHPITGEVIASVDPTPKTFRLAPGEKILDEQGNIVAEAKDRPIVRVLSPGQIAVNEAGDTVAQGAEESDEFTLSPGQQRFKDGEVVASVPPEEDIVPIFDENSPTKISLAKKSEAFGEAGPPKSPLITITQQGETAMAKELGKRDAERVSKLEDDAQTAFRTLAETARMRAAIESGRFTPGVFSDVRVFLARFADFVGASAETKELVGDAATADTLDAAANRLSVEAAEKLGRITNMSLQFVKDSLPSLVRTPEGNMILIEVMERTAEREIQLANLAEDYIQRHGTLRPQDTKTYFQAVRDLEDEDPVITEELRQRIIKGSSGKIPTFVETFSGAVDKLKGDELPTYSTPEEVEKLPAGTEYIWGPNGKRYRTE